VALYGRASARPLAAPKGHYTADDPTSLGARMGTPRRGAFLGPRGDGWAGPRPDRGSVR